MAKTDTYTKGFILKYPEGDISKERSTIQYKPDIKDKAYTIIDGDTLTAISKREYGSPRHWYLIADVNLNIDNPFNLITGTDIVIPNIERYNL